MPLFLFSYLWLWSDLSIYTYKYTVEKFINEYVRSARRPCVNPIFFFRLYGRDFFKICFYSPTIYVTIGTSHWWLHLASDPLEIYIQKMIYLRLLLMWSANGNMFSYIFLSTGFFRFSPFFFCFLSTVCLLGAGDVFSPRSITPENQISNADIISYQVYYST